MIDISDIDDDDDSAVAVAVAVAVDVVSNQYLKDTRLFKSLLFF
jgi:cation transport regulator ChaB